MKNLKTKFIFVICLIVFCCSFLFIGIGLAADDQAADAISGAVAAVDTFSGTDLVTNDNVPQLVGNAISQLLGIIGSVALVIFIASGIMWMMSEGNAEKISKSQKSMIWAAIGMFAIFASYTVMKFVINQLAF